MRTRRIEWRRWISVAVAVWACSLARGAMASQENPGNAPGTMAVTNGNVTWSGAAGGGNRNWDEPANWVENVAPTNPTAATIYFKTNGQAVAGLLEADRQIGGVYFDAGPIYSNIAHVVDLGGRALTLAGNMTGMDYRGWNFRLTNGTLRLGTVATAANLTIGRLGDATLTLSPGTFLDTVNLGSVSLGEHSGSGNGDAILDLRGCQVVGGILRMRSLSLASYSYHVAFVYLDGATGISSIEVSNTVSLGASFGPGAWLGDSTYVGNPANSGKLPPNISLKIGSSPAQRGNLIINRLISSSYVGTRTDKLVATSGGTFTAYLTNLWVAANGVNAGDSAPQFGLLDISRMNSCSVDALDVRLGVPASPLSTDNIKGEWRVCSGTVTAGTVVVGASTGKGYGLLALSNTLFTVTNSLTINTTGTNLVSVGAEPSGFDVQGSLVDGGGRILVSFVANPAVGTNWAIRIKGDVQSTLNAMIGASPSRLTSTGTYPNKKAGVLYDAAAGYTYYALADSNEFATLPVAIAHDERTYEIAPAGTVVIGTNDINNGSSDPDSRPLTLTIYTNGGPESTSLTFNAAGDYGVTLKVAANSDSATDTCTVHVVAVNPGVTNALTWKGGAPTALMDRREWMWSANWLEGVPPSNPTPARILYKYDGQSVRGIVEQARTVGGIRIGQSDSSVMNHTLDLGGTVLTLAGDMDNTEQINSVFSLTNGTLRIGSDAVEGNLLVGASASYYGSATLQCLAGTILDTYRVGTVRAGTATGGSNSQVGRVDLRKASVAGGVLRARNIVVGARDTCYIALDGTTSISMIAVSNSLTVGESGYSGTAYIGNPGDAGYRLPPNVNLTVGSGPGSRGELQIGKNSFSEANAPFTATVAASGGGTFSAWLTTLKIVPHEAAYNFNAQQNGTLDLMAMTGCTVDVQSVLVAPNYSANASAQPRGILRLPPGSVVAGTVEVGATNGGANALGLLAMSNTTFTVTDTLVINRSGRVEINVGSQSSGLMLANAAGSALSLATATNGALRIAFREPSATRPHYGLAWAGDHKQTLLDMQADGRLVVDSAGLVSTTASIFKQAGTTYVGIAPDNGLLLLIQ